MRISRLFAVFLMFCSSSVPVFAQGPGGVTTNLRLWMKAGNGVTGSPVSSWTDQSVNGFTASQATVIQRPTILTNRVNFNPAIQFDGSNDQLVITNGIFATSTVTDVYVFGVFRTNTVSASSVFLETLPAGGRFNTHVPWTDNTLYWDAGSAGAPQRISTPWVSSTGNSILWTLTASTTNTPSGAKQDIYRNGLILANDNNMSSFTGNNGNFSIGNGFGFYNGEVAELVVYRGAITAAQLQRIHSYLALKYGITLDQSTAQNYVASDGTVIWNGTTLSGFKQDIAGIGRDDNSGLSQLKSSSLNGDLITVANSSISSPAAFGSNLQFLTWGHNGLGGSADPAVSAITHGGISIESSLQRIWRTAATGSPSGNAIVEFNMNNIGGGTSANANLLLLLDDDGVFGNGSAGETTIAPTAGFSVTGGVVDFTVPYATLSTRSYFTLGSSNAASTPLGSPSPGGTTVATKLWLKGDAGVTGSPVSAWADQSGNGFTASQVTVGNRPTFTSNRINFNPALTFDGAVKQMTITNGIMGTSTYTDFNVLTVIRTAAIISSSVFYEGMASSGRVGVHIPWSDGILYWDAGSPGPPQRLNTPWTGTLNTTYVWSLLASTSVTPSGGRQEIYKNGSLLASDNDMSSFTGNSSTFYLGSLAGASLFSGDIAELIVLTGNVNTTQLQKLQSYLAVKYGITLDQTTPTNYYASNWNGTTGTVIWDATTAGTYKQDIAAIGRDDNSSLNQKQSASVNTGNVLTIGNTSIATDNASNGNAFSVNRSFFSWAHNGSALSGNGVTDIGTTTNSVVIKSRLARVWKAQETGTVGTLKVRIDLSTVPGAGGVVGNNDLVNARLLVDADGVFATGATAISPTTFSNVTHIADFDVDFTGGTGFYFTVGSTNLTTTPLPIELISFDAAVEGNAVHLAWKTATEKNNDYFEVQSSGDGESWRKVAQVKGKGTTTVTTEYHAIDAQPLSGISYYRLKQVDFDGKFTYSVIRRVDFDGYGVQVYPNPAQDMATLEWIGDYPAVGVRVSTLTGQVVFEQEWTGSAPGGKKVVIPMATLPSGLYIVTVIHSDGRTQGLRLMKR